MYAKLFLHWCSTDPHRCTGPCTRISLEIQAQRADVGCALIALEGRMITLQSVDSVRHAIKGGSKMFLRSSRSKIQLKNDINSVFWIVHRRRSYWRMQHTCKNVCTSFMNFIYKTNRRATVSQRKYALQCVWWLWINIMRFLFSKYEFSYSHLAALLVFVWRNGENILRCLLEISSAFSSVPQ